MLLLCVRNEEVCIGNALSHLKANGIKYAVIDNGSDDDASPAVCANDKQVDIDTRLRAGKRRVHVGEVSSRSQLRKRLDDDITDCNAQPTDVAIAGLVVGTGHLRCMDY
jgi:hypothetical protein